MKSYNILELNKQFCIQETMKYIFLQTSTRPGPFDSFPETEDSIEFCQRDLGFVIDAYIDGLKNNNSDVINLVSSRYWKGDVSVLVGNKDKEILAHDFLKTLIIDYIFSNKVYENKLSEENQILSDTPIEEESKSKEKIIYFYYLLTDTIKNKPKNKFLHNHLSKRITTKWWDDTPVEDYKLETILEAAYQAPSKQGKHEFEIYILSDSLEGRDFKEWLFWENTACLGKVRAAPGPGLRRYNGQVLAPIVMVWLTNRYQVADRNNYGENDFNRTRDDCIISATMALCQAEELGVRTGFCGTIGPVEIAQRLGRPNMIASIVVGFGYAQEENIKVKKVFKDGVEMGFDLANLTHTSRELPNRISRPPKYNIINYI
jgi:nitroreductase